MRKFVFNDNKSICIDYSKALISSININGQEFIQGNSSFFMVKLRNIDNSSLFIDGSEFKYLGLKDGFHVYSHLYLLAKISIRKINNNLSFKIKITNNSKYMIEQVELASFGVKKTLCDEPNGIGEIYIPYNEGARVTNMKKRESTPFHYYDVDYPSKGIFFVFPNMISSQFLSYNINNRGILLWMLDNKRTPKHIDFRYDKDAIRLQMRTFCDVTYSQNYEMTFETRLTLYDGDFYDACDIYRKWFKKNLPNGVRTIKEKYNEFPQWYHKPLLVVTYPICGTKDTDSEMKPNNSYPYTNGYKYIDYISKKTGCSILALLMQWESTAPWVNPYVWPPYGDMDNFFQYRDTLHKNGHYLGLYTSGFGWTNISHLKKYNMEKEFISNRIEEIVCTDSVGNMTSTIVSNIRKGFDLCPSMQKTKDLIVKEVSKLIDAKIDYVQVLDQNHGGNSYFCYSDKHGHIPAPGSWQVEETHKLLEAIDLKHYALLGCESASSEPFLDRLSFSDNRMILNQYIGDYIPMYSYIYHEYINNFMGNGICNLLEDKPESMTFRLAYSFLCGDLLTAVIDGNGKLHASWCSDTIIDDELPYEFIKKLYSIRSNKNYSKFLHYGKMIKPIGFKSETLYFDGLYGYKFEYPSVLTSAFKINKSSVQFIVNFSLIKQTIEFEKNAILYDDKNNAIESNIFDLDPLSIYFLKNIH